jgi:hypothetical protein
MNLDFTADPLFSWYVVLLCFTGVAMVILSTIKAAGQSTGWRVFNALVGAGFLGYGIYLGIIFQGGTYLMFFKAFILPVLLIVNFFRSLAANRQPEPAQDRT